MTAPHRFRRWESPSGKVHASQFPTGGLTLCGVLISEEKGWQARGFAGEWTPPVTCLRCRKILAATWGIG